MGGGGSQGPPPLRKVKSASIRWSGKIPGHLHRFPLFSNGFRCWGMVSLSFPMDFPRWAIVFSCFPMFLRWWGTVFICFSMFFYAGALFSFKNKGNQCPIIGKHWKTKENHAPPPKSIEKQEKTIVHCGKPFEKQRETMPQHRNPLENKGNDALRV